VGFNWKGAASSAAPANVGCRHCRATHMSRGVPGSYPSALSDLACKYLIHCRVPLACSVINERDICRVPSCGRAVAFQREKPQLAANCRAEASTRDAAALPVDGTHVSAYRCLVVTVYLFHCRN
jgi:hypothetical protein